jgi:hypothetical protein
LRQAAAVSRKKTGKQTAVSSKFNKQTKKRIISPWRWRLVVLVSHHQAAMYYHICTERAVKKVSVVHPQVASCRQGT